MTEHVQTNENRSVILACLLPTNTVTQQLADTIKLDLCVVRLVHRLIHAQTCLVGTSSHQIPSVELLILSFELLILSVELLILSLELLILSVEVLINHLVGFMAAIKPYE